MAKKYQNEGLHIVNKPRGISSTKCMLNFKHTLDPPLPQDVKIGYAGTLDVLAEGLLMIGVGRAYTKQLQELSDADKVYETVINMSGWTESGDLEQTINKLPVFDEFDIDKIYDVLESMSGPQKQTPPSFSAKKVNGERAYVSAREGREVELRPCQIVIHSIELLDYTYPRMEIRVTCSKGTFIRTLAMDIGSKLTGGAYVEKLVRVRVGDYEL
jgi:tRNA pseudouridine55 synthase